MPNADIALVLAFVGVAVVVWARVDTKWIEPRRQVRRQVRADLAFQQGALLCRHTSAGGRCPRRCGLPTEKVS